MWFFGKKRAKKKALQEEQLKMQQESKKKGTFVGGKPAPAPVKAKKEVTVAKVVKKEEPVKVQPKEVKAAKAKEEPVDDKKNKKYHVSQNKDARSDYYKKWRVRKEGSSKTIKYFETQAEAIEYAQDLADKNDSSIVIHKLDGSIRKQEYK
ncbi:DUF2188 domain-containing protein [Mariniplasma anaerobium]|uniref:DUF2188 domain-containing protein n=1 Tax=Mariniplasma anaerobium TaxID=2735436 RepID=A0A7U9TJ15_9MOLU|nr:DUF2188 domain-containing protein [Mariniplasma anaerobium]BCR36498.1 hypothetical protein MPAN_013910 [Mariniplasma anaerobium]